MMGRGGEREGIKPFRSDGMLGNRQFWCVLEEQCRCSMMVDGDDFGVEVNNEKYH